MKKSTLLIIIAVLIAVIGVASWIGISKYQKVYNEWQTATANEKAYESRILGLSEDCREFQFTIDQLKYSKDSIVQQLMETKDKLKIKDKNIIELEYMLSQFHVTDSIFFTDTIFVNNFMCDTTIGDEWMSTHLQLKYPNEVRAESTAKSEKNVIISSKRETVNPPKKFFLCRWFQKKHTVIRVDTEEKNPHIQSEQNVFIKVI